MPITLALALPLWFTGQTSVLAEGYDDELVQREPHGTVTSVEAYTTGDQTAVGLNLAAEYCVRNGRYDEAIKYIRRAIAKDPEEIDAHKTYAEALQQKVEKEPNADPKYFNRCVKEWLIVLRAEVGDEKGLTFRGLNPFGHYYEDEDRAMVARYRLIALTGQAPKPWQTDVQFMKQVCKNTQTVTGHIIASRKPQAQASEKREPAPPPAAIFMK